VHLVGFTIETEILSLGLLLKYRIWNYRMFDESNFVVLGYQAMSEAEFCPVQKQTYLFSISSFGGLEVACWPLVPKFAGSHLAVGFLGRKNSQHAFLRRGSKAICPMS